MDKEKIIKIPEYGAEFLKLHPQLFRMERTLDKDSPTNPFEVMGDHWCFSVFYLKDPVAGYWQQDGYHMLQGWNALFLPPFSVTKLRILPAKIMFKSYFSFLNSSVGSIKYPVRIPLKKAFYPSSPMEVIDFVVSYKEKININFCPHPSAIAENVKSYIDLHFKSTCNIIPIAKQLRTSPAVVSRYFKSSYGLSPVHYRNLLRVRNTMTTLLFSNDSITNIGQAEGFGDSSQLNRNFQKYAGITPSLLHLS